MNGEPNTAREALRGVRLVVFDLDGTLVDSSRDLAAAVNFARARLGLGPHSLERVMGYIGHGARELVRRSIGEISADGAPDGKAAALPDELLDPALDYFREYYAGHLLDQTRPYPGVREALEQLASRSDARLTLAVLTNKPYRFTRLILDGLSLTRHFRFIAGEDTFPTKKPDPAGLLTFVREAGTQAHEALMVGDSDTDVQTARNAGARACGVSYGLSSHLLRECPPDVMVDDLRELAARLS